MLQRAFIASVAGSFYTIDCTLQRTFCVRSGRRSIACDNRRKLIVVECPVSDNGLEPRLQLLTLPEVLMVFTPDETAQSGLHFKSSASHHFTRLWQGRVLYQRKRTMAGTLLTVWKCLWRQVCETTLDSLPPPPAPVSGCMDNVSSVLQLLGWNLQHQRPPPRSWSSCQISWAFWDCGGFLRTIVGLTNSSELP